MSEIKLVVGDLSTWSMRTWMCLKLANVEFTEIVVPLGKAGCEELLTKYSDSKLVPVLVHNDNRIHDSLAIAEFLNELSHGKLYPKNQIDRAHCRSLCAELHSGFIQIRTLCPYSFDGGRLTSNLGDLKPELDRLESIWSRARGVFYFDEPSIFDAYYDVMAHRLAGYGVNFEGFAGEYQRNAISWYLFAESLARARNWCESAA